MRTMIGKLAIVTILTYCVNMATAQKAPTINHVAISVTNLKRSINFYSNIVGLDTIPEPFKDGKHAWFSLGEKITLHIIEDAPEIKTHYKNAHLCLSTSNLAAFIDQLRTRNIEFENVKGSKGELTTRVDGVQQIYFRDPDGYWIEMNNAKN